VPSYNFLVRPPAGHRRRLFEVGTLLGAQLRFFGRLNGIIMLLNPSPWRHPLPDAATPLRVPLSLPLREARERVGLARGGAPTLVSVTAEVAPEDPIQLFASASGRRCFWDRPFDGFAAAGIGVAWETANPVTALHGVRSQIQDLAQNAIVISPAAAGPSPMIFGAVPFSMGPAGDAIWETFDGSSLTLPEVALIRRNGRSWLTVNQMVCCLADLEAMQQRADEAHARVSSHPGLRRCDVDELSRFEIPNRDKWTRTIEDAVDAITAGDLSKVVLARRYDLRFSEDVDPVVIVEHLRAAYPETAIFAIGRDDQTFLGASPEPLAEVSGSRVRVNCLAGSIARGLNERADRDLAERLRHDDKNRREQNAVVDFVVEKLTPLCKKLEIDPEPAIMTVKNIHHLSSWAVGELRAEQNILDVVGALHPTPAVAGVPVDVALDFIHRHEPFERGLYAGPVGWMTLSGDGEFAVAIRSGLIHGDTVRLFAGCGIVAGSDPEDEWQETNIKLQPMLSALEAR
jgi:menaquinone-specific isochorismate synthase